MTFPQFAVSKWIGHSLAVSGKHYVQHVPDELYRTRRRRIRRSTASAPVGTDRATDRGCGGNRAGYGTGHLKTWEIASRCRPVLTCARCHQGRARDSPCTPRDLGRRTWIRVRLVERRALAQSPGQVGVGDEPPGSGRMTAPNRTASASPAAMTSLAAALRELLVGDVDAAELPLELAGRATSGDRLLAAGQERELATCPSSVATYPHVADGSASVDALRVAPAGARCMPTRPGPHTSAQASATSSISRARFCDRAAVVVGPECWTRSGGTGRAGSRSPRGPRRRRSRPALAFSAPRR